METTKDELNADQLNSAVQAFNDVAGRTGFYRESGARPKARTVDGNSFAIQLTNESRERLANRGVVTDEDIGFRSLDVLDGDTTTRWMTTPKPTASSDASATLPRRRGHGRRRRDWVTGQLVLDSDRAFSWTPPTPATSTIAHREGGTGITSAAHAGGREARRHLGRTPPCGPWRSSTPHSPR